MELAFQFADQDGVIQPLIFRHAEKIIMARTADKVMPCLNEVQKAVESGYYAAGYVSYEAAPAFDTAFQVLNTETVKLPLLWFGIFKEPITGKITGSGSYTLSDWIPSVTKSEYKQSIAAIKKAIEQGDTYQVNYTLRMNAEFKGDARSFFYDLAKAQSSEYTAFLDIGDFSILSASPELFFRVDGRKITAKPMKGTVKRGKTFKEDKEKENWLAHSAKNRSENVMIVDLLRNDLGMVANPGTIQVSKLFEVEQYPTVHQMTSTITAELTEKQTIVDIFKALFPCGSITGAPKISTMQLIAQLETAERNVYCGALGYITPKGQAVFNVPIRTVLIDKVKGIAEYGVGGGITWDSTVADEYEEVLTKAEVLTKKPVEFELLESIRLSNGSYFLLDRHLSRMEQSARYFKFPCDLENIKQTLRKTAFVHPQGEYKIRLLCGETGEYRIEADRISERINPIMAILAEAPISKENVFLYHKTTYRSVYTGYQQKYHNFDDVLLWNEDGELTEFTNGNLVVEWNGNLYTPDAGCGLLAGTFREELLEKGVIVEKVLTVKDLADCTNIWFINSVREWVQVNLIIKK